MTESLKKPALHPDDGATFYGNIQRIEKNLFQANGRVELGDNTQPLNNMPSFGTEHEAREWLSQQAMLLGYDNWYEEKF